VEPQPDAVESAGKPTPVEGAAPAAVADAAEQNTPESGAEMPVALEPDEAVAEREPEPEPKAAGDDKKLEKAK
jgi:hypothetical protein